MSEYNSDKVAIVANPFSGARRNPQRVEALMGELHRRGLEPMAMWGRDDLKHAAAEPQFAQQYRCIVAAGGDGTLHRVVNTTLAVPIAHFPLGTENLFARHFAHPANPAGMAAAIASGGSTTIDLGRAVYGSNAPVASRLFTIVASAGFDAQVIHSLDRWRSRRPDRLRRVRRTSYLRPILGAALGYGYPLMDLQADDGPRRRGAMCMVFNLPRYGMDFRICPTTVADDGLLDYVVFERPGSAALMSYALSVKLGRHHSRPDVHTGRARSIRITPSAGGLVPLEIDGEEANHAPVEIHIVPAAMRVITA